MAPETATLLCLAFVLGGATYAVRVHRDPGRGELTPAGRPIEEIAADVRRLGTRYHGLAPRASFVKSDGVRRAYDGVLAECCAALGLTHLLGVIAPGPELDSERARVEGLLDDSGLRLPFAA